MGITIHYEGKYSTLEQWNKIVCTAKEFAERNKLDYFLFDETKKIIDTRRGIRPDDHGAIIKMLVIQPHVQCDPFILQLDSSNCIRQFCKTQYSEARIHILVIELLKEIRPFFESFTVVDEGGYWETNNMQKLLEHFQN